jgi:hypothetical protein
MTLTEALARIAVLEEALDDIWMHGVDGPTAAWVMVSKVEWDQAFERAKLQPPT